MSDEPSLPLTGKGASICDWGRADVVGLLVIVLVGVAMAWWSWLRWPDPIIDFGRELYTPWQLVEGKVLYRDMALFNGPLSQYFNALLFAVFGVGLRTLVVANLLILAGTVGLIYIMVRDLASPFAATISGLTIVLLFAFSQYTRFGNYNWICPYSHELTHGLALSLLAVWLTGRWVAARSLPITIAMGMVVGLVFLTKVEVFVACIGTVALASFIPLITRSRSMRQWLVEAGLFIGGFVVPPLLAWLALSAAMPKDIAWQGTIGSWAYVLDQQHSTLPFFQWSMGAEAPAEQLANILITAGWYALVIGPWVAICITWKRTWVWRIGAVAIAALAIVIVVWTQGESLRQSPLNWYLKGVPWSDLARPWPLMAVAVIGALIVTFWKKRTELSASLSSARGMIYASFALLLMLKMLLNARLWHYGFALGLPAAVVLVVVMFDGLPLLLRRACVNVWMLRAGLLFIWLGVVVAHLHVVNTHYRIKTHSVAQGVDTFRSNNRGKLVDDALRYLRTHAGAADTMTVLPDGEMIPYLMRRTNPSRYGNFIPATLVLFGEDQMLSSLQSNPPTWIVLAHRKTNEYGAEAFGRDYAGKIWRWIQSDYIPAYQCGAPPFNPDNRFGIVIARRRSVTGPDEKESNVERE